MLPRNNTHLGVPIPILLGTTPDFSQQYFAPFCFFFMCWSGNHLMLFITVFASPVVRFLYFYTVSTWQICCWLTIITNTGIARNDSERIHTRVGSMVVLSLTCFSSFHVCCHFPYIFLTFLLSYIWNEKSFFFLLLVPLNTWQIALRNHYYYFCLCPVLYLLWFWKQVHKRKLTQNFRKGYYPWWNLGIANHHPQV